jgi:DDE domain
MTSVIATGFSRFRALSVVAGSVMASYGHPDLDVRQVAKDLKVQYVLTGGVKRRPRPRKPRPLRNPSRARKFSANIPKAIKSLILSLKYVTNSTEQNYRSIKLRLGPMLGFKQFRRAATTIADIELMHRIRKDQFKLARPHIKDKTAPEIWNAVLAA